VEAGFGLEPLSGEAGVDGGACGGAHAAKGGVAGGPDLGPGGVGRKGRAANVIGADKAGDTALDNRNRLPAQPSIFTDQRIRRLGTLGIRSPLSNPKLNHVTEQSIFLDPYIRKY